MKTPALWDDVTDLLSANHAASTDFTAAATFAESRITRTEKDIFPPLPGTVQKN